MTAKRLKKAAVVLTVLSAALLIFTQCYSYPLIRPQDAVEVYHVERVVTEKGEGDFVDVPLTGETKRAVEELLRAQRCRGLIWNPYPMSVSATDWEIRYRVNNRPGHYAVYGIQDFTYSSAPARGPVLYAHLTGGKEAAAALAEIFS